MSTTDKLLVLATFLLVPRLGATQILLNSPSCAIDHNCTWQAPAAVIEQEPPELPDIPRPPRTADRTYWTVVAITHLFTEADDRTTAKFLNDPRRRCTEANPILGERPTQLKVAALEHGVATAFDVLGYFIKRSTDRRSLDHVERNAWMTPALILSFGHGFAAQVNATCW